ncbi:MAG: LysM peptidoglycan-binding domain-containing protein [Bacillota bacterium]
MTKNDIIGEIRAIYKLSKGESLQKVAVKFSIPTSAIASANKNIKIHSGVYIAIPTVSQKTYTVRAGDSINSICDKFQISKQQFQEKNGSAFIYCGMIIFV